MAAVQVWVRAGAADERRDQAGLAHLHEHMIFKGSDRRGVGAVAGDIEASGGDINAWTSFEQTVYHAVSAVSELEIVLDVLSDAICHARFDERELEREIEVIVEEIHRAHDSPARRLSRAMFEAAYLKHPYRFPVLGTLESVRSFDRSAVLEFYRQFYRPENTTVVIVGDGDAESLLERVVEFFGGWRVDGECRRPLREEEPEQNEVRLAPVPADVKEARASIAWSIPGAASVHTPSLDALTVILGHGDSSRLAVEVERKRQVVNAVGAHMFAPMDSGLFVVSATMREEHVYSAVASMADEVTRVATEGVEARELEKARNILLSDAHVQRETVEGLAGRLGMYETVFGDFRREEHYTRSISELNVDDIRVAARRFLRAPPTVTVLAADPHRDNLLPIFTPPKSEAFGDSLRTARKHSASRSTLSARSFSPNERGVGRASAESAPKHGSLSAKAPSPVVVKDLNCGVRVLIASEPSPVVAIRCVALGGLRWEPPEQLGLTHLLTGCWGRALPDVGAEKLAERVAVLGGSMAAFSGRNTLGLRAEFTGEQWRPGFELCADVAARSVVSAFEFERERTLALQNIRNRADRPAGMAMDRFLETLYPDHPYGRRLVGTEATVQRLTLDDLERARRVFLRPDRFVVTLVGDVEVEFACEALERAFTGNQSGSPVPAPCSPDARPDALRRCQVFTSKKQSHIVIGAMGTTVNDNDRYALQVLTTILAGQGGRLFLDLRDSQSLAYSVSSSNVEGLDPGHVLTYGATSPKSTAQMVRGLHGHLDALLDATPKTHELDRAKKYLLGTHGIDLQRAGARAMAMGLGEAFGLGYSHYVHYPDRIRAVTSEDVRRVAHRFLSRSSRVEVVLGPG